MIFFLFPDLVRKFIKNVRQFVSLNNTGKYLLDPTHEFCRKMLFKIFRSFYFYIFSCDQAALRTDISVCLCFRLSVCPSVCDTFFTMFLSSYHHEIFRSDYQWQKWCLCKRSRSEVKWQGHRGHDPIQPFPDRNSSLNSHMVIKWCIKLDVA